MGKPFSKHLEGKASDVIVKGVHSHTVYKYLTERYPDSFGFGKYNTFTHIDCRSGRAARWEITG